VKVWAKLS